MVLRFLLPLVLFFPLLGAAGETVNSDLFKKTTLVYSENFDHGPLDLDFWEIRQRSRWTVEDGILKGRQSAPEFQARKIAAGERAHAGIKPVIWLKQVPAEFVCTMRLRYNGAAFHPKYPLIDLGLKKGTLLFSMNGETQRFDSDLIDMRDQRQIDFKGLNRGSCEIDWIRVWSGE